MQIVLIGMPGCGKTTVGRLLAEKCNCAFLDLDEKIEKETGRKISEIFANDGETAFRDMETSVLIKALAEDGTVISTGGGVVTRKENRILLQNRKAVVFLDRPLVQILSDVDVKERPLLADGCEKVKSLYNERYALYCASASLRICNDLDAETAAERIMKALNL